MSFKLLGWNWPKVEAAICIGAAWNFIPAGTVVTVHRYPVNSNLRGLMESFASQKEPAHT